ncbi:mutator protein MutT [Antricoccus suffuscus]|uniref:8-oxo-dGTP diphosphatase n=1 Tax=Antricoccus suffuscus TaxID=1629062 RepID=A0A2T0ZZP1_9ACTN|nr:NUDIX domain-containing protein [Antricoccus suffuscus]PRZ41821.1 mutator protein MutT [Antricoccus suffuscus]
MESTDRVVVGVAVVRDGLLLAAQRTSPPAAAGRWELPGGKVEPGESLAQAAVREIQEELGCTVVAGADLGVSSPVRPGLTLRVVLASLASGEPTALEHSALRWVGPERLDELNWMDADRPFLSLLRERQLDGVPLEGGGTGGAVRIGETVRRPTGPWTPAVHELLRFLHGRASVPEVLGFDARGREILRYIPGTTIRPDDEMLTDAQVVAVARRLRVFHDVVASYRPTGVVTWRYGDRALADDEIICHNDPGAYNWAFSGDDAVGLFDWDMAGPGVPLDDVGFAAWTCMPLYRDIVPPDIARRLSLFAQAYGKYDAREIFDASLQRMRLAAGRIAEGQARGDAGLLNLAKVGEPRRTRDRVARAESARAAIERLLDRDG